MLNIPAALCLSICNSFSATQRNHLIMFSFYWCVCGHAAPYWLIYSSCCAAISTYPGWKCVLKWNAKHFKLPNILARRIPKLFTFLDGHATPLAACRLCSWPVETSSDIRHMFLFWSTFQWWILSLRLCPLATKHQPAPWVVVCGYNSVGRDQYITESGMTMPEQHPVWHYIGFSTQSVLDSEGLSALFILQT